MMEGLPDLDSFFDRGVSHPEVIGLHLLVDRHELYKNMMNNKIITVFNIISIFLGLAFFEGNFGVGG